MPKRSTPAQLILQDGTVFHGESFGSTAKAHQGLVDGEVVFNTGMAGYPESLTDPSYRGQILTLTYPLVGNYGVPDTVLESDHVQVRGLIVSQYEAFYSHHSATKSLGEWLTEEGVPAITGIDTRALTKRLREHGVMLGRIHIGNYTPAIKRVVMAKNSKNGIIDPNTTNLVAEVSVSEPVWYTPESSVDANKQVLLVDCGVKQGIIDNFLQRGITIKRVPWDYNYLKELGEFNGLFISNGPGDPKQCKPTIKYLKKALDTDTPQFGICLGSQLQSIAAGGKTYKLKYGHRGQNQPVILAHKGKPTKQAILTSQNHGYAVKPETLPKQWEVLYWHANDGSVQGIQHKKKPFFSVQFHPESNPGPTDANFLFDEFLNLL